MSKSEGVGMEALADHASKPGRIVGREALEAPSPREIFRRTRTAVFDAAPRCGEKRAAIVVTSPLLTRADVRVAFEEITEKYRLAGINLRFDEQCDGSLQAIFEPIDPAR